MMKLKLFFSVSRFALLWQNDMANDTLLFRRFRLFVSVKYLFCFGSILSNGFMVVRCFRLFDVVRSNSIRIFFAKKSLFAFKYCGFLDRNNDGVIIPSRNPFDFITFRFFIFFCLPRNFNCEQINLKVD